MKIYTKKGDQGRTSLLGGDQVLKSNVRIEAYGTIDELNAYIGLIKDIFPDQKAAQKLLEIQETLFVIGSHLASTKESAQKYLPNIDSSSVKKLEKDIDAMEKKLKPLTSFILPGGSVAISYCHVARCVCRRAERAIVLLDETSPVQPIIIQYINRLSDYLFVLARYSAHIEHVEEIKWTPKKGK